LQPSSSDTKTDSEKVAESFPAEVEVQPPVTCRSLQELESHEELSAVDQSVNGVAVQPGDYQLSEATAEGGAVITSNDAELAAAEQCLLLELQANELHAAAADNISSSSHSLNDQLDAEVLQSFVPPAVDAACRLSESSVDGPATCGIGRNVHLLDWLEEQAQLRGVSSVSPHGADVHHDAVISDEDDVEHAVFEDNLQDIFAALEAEVMANPFLVPITPQTSDMCVNPMTSERFSFEDDSSLGALEASGGVVESTRNVDSHDKEVSALSDEESKQTGAAGIAAELEGDARRASQLSLSISSEGGVVVEHVNDLTDPLEVLEIESRALPPQLRSKPVCLSSDSDSLSGECGADDEKLQDVADVLDRVDETRRLSISDVDENDQAPVAADVRPLASDTSSDNSSVGPGCVEEEADALAALDEAEKLTAGDVGLHHGNSDEDGPSAASSSSAVDSDPAGLGNFVEQVMMHQSAGSEVISADDDQATERVAATELDPIRQQSETAEEDTARSEYARAPSCATDDVLSAVAHVVQLTQVLELPQGGDAAAISDEDDVEEGIEHSLDDVFAALEAEARRCSVPRVTAPTLLDIGHDSFDDDDDETPFDLMHTSAPDTGLTELAEAVLVRTDSEDIPGVTDEHVAAEGSRQETVDTDVGRCPLPDDAGECAEVGVVEEHRASPAEDDHNVAVELAREDISSETASTTETCNVQDKHDETFLSHSAENRQDSDTFGSLVAVKVTAEEIAETNIPHVPETSHFDSKSAKEVNIDDNVDGEAPAEPCNGDDEKVNVSSVCDARECVTAEDAPVQQSVENASVDIAAQADTEYDGTKAAGTSTQLATEVSEEQRENITDVTDGAAQSS